MYGSTRCVCRAVFIFLINTIVLFRLYPQEHSAFKQAWYVFCGFILFTRSLKMNNKMYETLEFNKVLNILEECALSEKAKSRIKKLEPFISESDDIVDTLTFKS